MPSKKQILASALLCAAIGMSAGCQGEQGPLLNPKTGEPSTEQDLETLKRFYGLSNPTQREVNELQSRLGSVHPKALAAETPEGLKEYLRKHPEEVKDD